MPTEFHAEFVYTESNDDLITVGFADTQFNTEKYILLQRSISITAQDKLLGLDNIYITFLDQSRSNYGGILKFELKRNLLLIELTEQAANILKTEPCIAVDISSAPFDLLAVSETLKQLCNGLVLLSTNDDSENENRF